MLKIAIDDWLLHQAGKILMVTGLLGIILDVRYDVWVGRAPAAYSFGPWQWIGAVYCCFLIYVGYIFDRFTDAIK